MRPPGYVVRTSLENQTQRLTRGQIGRTNTVAPCEAAVIHLLSPNACSTLPLSMMHRDEHNVNRHLKLFSCDKDQRKKHGSYGKNKPADLTSTPLGLINPELDKTAKIFPQTAATLPVTRLSFHFTVRLCILHQVKGGVW